MLIDWITVAAQIVNFLILVVLLKVFLYDKIIQAMDKREQRIADRLGDAESRKQEAESEKREFLEKKKRLAEDRKKVMDEAERQAEARRKELVEKARAEVDEMAGNWRKSIEREREDLVSDLVRMTADQAVRIAGRAVFDLAGKELSECAAEVFLEKLEDLSKEDREALAQGAREAGRIEVLSGDELSGNLRSRITRAVHDHVVGDAGVEVEYSTGGVRLGFVLRVKGRKFDWSLDGYLDEYREKVSRSLEGEMRKMREGASEQKDEAAREEDSGKKAREAEPSR